MLRCLPMLTLLLSASLLAPVRAATLAPSDDACEALIEAVQDVDVDTIKQRLVRTDPDCTVPMEGSPLIAAAEIGLLPLVKLLVEAGASVDLGIEGDGNPLIAASGAGWTHVAAYLIEQGADVNAVVVGDETPLINAAAGGHLALVRVLVKAGADVNRAAWGGNTAAPERRTPLSMAQRYGHDEVAAYLMAEGARE
ncbi:MAG: ankyrin repeat domain-containing protein [Bacteroidota bacterium]